MLRILFCVTFFSCFVLQAAADGKNAPPSFSLQMTEFCSSRPYDCMDNGRVTGHLLNNFLYQFYFKVEDFFSDQGFEKAEFEYCNSTDCLEEGVSVKNSKYKITQVFPRKQDYFRAFGGVNRNLGIYFSRTLTEKQANDWCTTQVRQGNKLSGKAKRAIAKGKLSLWNLKTKYYKKHSLSYVRYLPQISALDQESDAKEDYCWLQYKKKKVVFETKEAFK